MYMNYIGKRLGRVFHAEGRAHAKTQRQAEAEHLEKNARAVWVKGIRQET